MRSNIKKEKKQVNTVRFLLSYDPSQLFLSLESPSERVRRRPSELRASSLAVRFRRRRAFASLGLRSVALATRFRWLLDASLSGLLWLTDSDGLSASGTRRPHPACGGVCHGSASLHGTPPRLSNTKKGRRFRLPSGISNSYSSKPCTTVSSVLESNAFAASVTGK